jgi:predicted PurR-regulated permease PerM
MNTPARRDPQGGRGPHLWEIQAVLDVLLILSVMLVVGLLYALSSVFTPVLVALGLAYLFNPLISAAQTRWRLPRPVTISLLLLVLTLGAVAFPNARAESAAVPRNDRRVFRRRTGPCG